MIHTVVKTVVYALLLVQVIHTELIYEWTDIVIKDCTKLSHWRPTSFEFAYEKFYLTLIDMKKDTPGIGLTGWFKPGDDPSPLLTLHGDRTDYRYFSKEGSVMAPMLVREDPCHDLWVMDANVYNLSGIQRKMAPMFHIYDRKSIERSKLRHFQDQEWGETSLFTDLVFGIQKSATAKDPKHCPALIAFIADFNGFHLLAYHYREDTSRKFSHSFFNSDPYVDIPDEYLFNKNHQNLSGIYGLTLADTDYGPMLFFHALASTVEYVVPVEMLQNQPVLHYDDIKMSCDKGALSEAGKTTFDPETNTFFYAELKTRKIGCLHLLTIFKHENGSLAYGRYDIGLREGIIMDLKVISGHLWILTYGKSRTTMRREPVSKVIESSRCSPPTNTFDASECKMRQCRRSKSKQISINSGKPTDIHLCFLIPLFTIFLVSYGL